MVIVVLGVAGSGKTTVGTMLAEAMRCIYLEGDALHQPTAIEKMSRGIPLTDADRAPWLTAINDRMLDFDARGEDLVVGCSALKEKYRHVLARDVQVRWVYLKASEALIRARLNDRTGHFMKADMLASQFEALEEPPEAIVMDASLSPHALVGHILLQLRAQP